MALQELRREALPKEVESTNLLTTLALKAEAVLGYSWLRNRLGIETGTLRDCLQQVGIEPFCGNDVKKYKSRKARQAERQAWAELEGRARRDGLPLFVTGSYARAQWRTVPLNGYKGEVPAFALSHALEIKERLPGAEFEIEELGIEKRYDPFLVATYGRERFYTDVWEEQEFEATHTQV